MIKKLRFKLIAVAMMAMFLVLAVIIGTINIMNYRGVLAEADEILAALAVNDGRLPTEAENRNGEKENGDAPKDKEKEERREEGEGVKQKIVNESRFFSALIGSDGQVLRTETTHINAIDDAAAGEMAQAIAVSKNTTGFADSYRYAVFSRSEGKLIIFLDCARNLNTYHRFLAASLGISAVGLVAVYILILLMSRWIMRPAQESYEKQRRFITDAGHEIKTPITIIDADAEVLEMELGGNEWLQDIRAQSRRLRDLTNNLIFLSRMEEEKAPLQMIEFPLSDMVSETVQSFQAVAMTQNKQVSAEVEPMLSMNGDQKSIRQLLSILLDNAVKYSPEGGQIRLTLRRQGKGVMLQVYNTAEQMDREELPYLFDRFYRTDKSRNSQTGGYGIGLSIAQAVVQAHKGKIWAASPDGRSLTVTAVLPL